MGVLVAACALLALVPPSLQAQSMLDQLNRILGRGGDAPASEPGRPGGPPPVSASPRSTPGDSPGTPASSPGAVGYVDYSMLVRLHPVLKLLAIYSDPRQVPLFTKDGRPRPLTPPAELKQAQAKRQRELKDERYQEQLKLNAEMQALNNLPRTTAEILNRLPGSLGPKDRQERERQALEDVAKQRADLQRSIDGHATRLRQIEEELDGRTEDSATSQAEYMRRIFRDFDEAIQEEYQERGLSLVLNAPQRPEHLFSRNENLGSAWADSRNHLADFFASSAGDDSGVLLSRLASWVDRAQRFEGFFPDAIWRSGVLVGGVDITWPVLDRVWRKYKVDDAHRRAAQAFLRGR